MSKFEFYYTQIADLKKAYDQTESETEREGIRIAYRNITSQINQEEKPFIRAFNYYEHAKECGNEYLDIDGIVWDQDAAELIQAMRANGIEKFTFSSTYSGATETAWIFQQEGCSLEGLVEVNKPTKAFMSNEWDKAHALLFKIN